MIFDVIKSTIMVTGFVLVIMLIIEYINVVSRGGWLKPIENKKWLQFLVAGLFGLIPGCVGTFAIVSMYVHNLIGFGALVTALITTFGDEAFVMFALIPGTTIKLSIILLAIGLAAGIVVDIFTKNKNFAPPIRAHLEIHNTETDLKFFDLKQIVQQLKNLTFPRAVLLVGIGLIILGIITGSFSEGHEHGHAGSHWSWEQILFLIINIIGFIIVLSVSEHFLEDHFWNHLLKKHFLKIFLWTFGALFFIEIVVQYLHWEEWIKSNQLIILLIAVLIGIIPESGPHLIFVTLFIQGTVPFSVLLASSIVQDGHGALPLLAESKKSFFIAKAINILVGLIVGLIGYFGNW
jgi:hypothetical protein